jgi:thiamine biosynthesis lipoprotein ApbE
MTRLPLLAAVLALALCAAAVPARADDDFRARVYLELPDALAQALPGADRIERADVRLGSEVRERVKARIGRKVYERTLTIFRGLGADGAFTGYAVVTEEIGKYKPITFVVGVTPDGAVRDAAVMVYRESHGGGVKRRRFLAQFVGKDLEDPIDPNRDIINISGATLSVRAIARGVKKVLVLLDETVLGAPTDGVGAPRWEVVRFGAAGPEREPTRGDEQGRGPGAGAGASVEKADAELVREARWRMGSVLEVSCFATRERARAAIGAAFREVARIEGLLSTWIAESELSRVNREARARAVPVSADTFACIARALEAARASGGAFDPTLVRDGWRGVELDPAARTIRFRRGDIALDLGGIAKGFAMDRAAEALEAAGVRCALFDFGGQLLALDPPPGLRGWPALVRDPRAPDAVLGGLSLARASLATSGSYERGPHIIDPRSGARSRAVLSASVRARDATTADALATALHVLGADAGAPLFAGAGPALGVVLAAGAAEARTLGAAPPASPFVPWVEAAGR